MKSANFNRFNIDPEKITDIKEYINILIKQIKKSTNLNYVILNLDGDYVNDLTRSLLDESNIFYLIRTYLKNRWIDDKLDIDDEDRTNHHWSLCITGFKHGAKKDSPRQLGLFAYKIGNLITNDRFLYSDIKDSTGKKKFKAIFFYDSYRHKISNDKIIMKKYPSIVIEGMNEYINNYEKYPIEINYIKPKMKSLDSKKKSKSIKNPKTLSKKSQVKKP